MKVFRKIIKSLKQFTKEPRRLIIYGEKTHGYTCVIRGRNYGVDAK